MFTGKFIFASYSFFKDYLKINNLNCFDINIKTDLIKMSNSNICIWNILNYKKVKKNFIFNYNFFVKRLF